MEIFAYTIINLFLFSSWYALLFGIRNILRFSDRLTGAAILGLSQIIATELLLGVVFRKLSSTPLFIMNLLLSLSVFAVAVLRGIRLNELSREVKNVFSRFFGLLKRDAVLLCIFILFLLSVCWIFFQGYLFPSYTWDALWYHLPMVGYMMQSGAIEEIPHTYFIEQFINIFPKNIELFFLWNTIFLHDDRIIDLSQFMFNLLGVLAVYGIARKLMMLERNAVYAGLFFFFTPIMILQSTTNYVDVAVSALFLVALNFLMGNSPMVYNTAVYGESAGHHRINILLTGLSTGILLGAKGSGPLFVFVMTAAFFMQEIVRNYHMLSKGVPVKILQQMKAVLSQFLSLLLMPVLVFGGYWYVKNWIIYGSPVYPMEISIFNVTIFKGLYGGIIDPSPDIINNLPFLVRPWYVWKEKVAYYLYDSRLSGFGPLWFILFLPSVVFSVGYALMKKKYAYLFVIVVLLAAFMLYPRNWNTRYVIFIVAMGSLSFGTALEYFDERRKVLTFMTLPLVVYVFLFSNSPCIMPKKIEEFLKRPAEERTIAWLAPFNLDLQSRQEYGYWIWLSRNMKQGDTLAYTFEPLFHAPLWNREFSNRIVSVKADHYDEWMQRLKQEGVTHILVRNRSKEDKWMMKENEAASSLWWVQGVKRKFTTVYADENYNIKRLEQQ